MIADPLQRQSICEGSETAFPANISQSPLVGEQSINMVTASGRMKKGGRTQWTPTTDAICLVLYDQDEPTKQGYTARFLVLWKKKFTEHNATEGSLATRVRRERRA